MGRIVDNLITYRILKKLVTSFKDTDAYKLGIIDLHGKNLIPTNKLKTSQERDAYTYLDRLVFNLKKIINKLPGGESRIKSLTTAVFLIKETVDMHNEKEYTEQQLSEYFHHYYLQDIVFVEEQLILEKLFEDSGVASGAGGAGGAPTNSVGDGTSISVDQTDSKKKNVKKNLTRKKKPIF